MLRFNITESTLGYNDIMLRFNITESTLAYNDMLAFRNINNEHSIVQWFQWTIREGLLIAHI